MTRTSRPHRRATSSPTNHLSPLLLGGGTRLFDLVGPTTLIQREVAESPRATHLTYEVVTGQATA